ncbi:hypothetical protein DOTSEDRAFT_24451 [Dothistroma septosporum NZE10]|uniref:Uncharacterized protein n=1 Tax=Dothistroma septosporum (strain NZE10 / CBS 128990) TaxID=675120 RepID=N1PPV2_DOTSN|nr:hypothetical protein DOTSEDRAFT_24451 [Dothistroma septosporum NZE10]
MSKYGTAPARVKHYKRNSAEPKTKTSTAPESLEDSPEHILRIEFDYGTVNLRVAYHLKQRGAQIGCEPVTVKFVNNEPDSPMILLFDIDQDTLLWGNDLERLILANTISRDEAIVMPKLALYSGFHQSPAAQTLALQSEALDARWGFDARSARIRLIQNHLKQIVDHTMDFLSVWNEGSAFRDAAFDVHDIEKEVYISVPQAWGPESNEVMAEAANRASLKGRLVLEPQCVAVYMMVKDKECADHLGNHQMGDKNKQCLFVDANVVQ